MDDLPFEDIIDDVIVYADGSVGCAYELSPIYVDSMDMSQLIELEKHSVGSFTVSIRAPAHRSFGVRPEGLTLWMHI